MKKIVSKKVLLDKLKAGEFIYNYVWWFKMDNKGQIYGGCNNMGCCDFDPGDFNDFDDLYNNFDKKDWHI